MDGNGFKLEKIGHFFQVLMLRVSLRNLLWLANLLISVRPQRQTNAEGCRIFGDLDQLKSKDTIQKTVD